MAERLNRDLIADKAIIHAETALRAPTRVDRSFELPAPLYAVTVGCFLAFLGVMAVGFANPEMILPMAIFALFIVAGFGIPTIWVRMKPDSGQHALTLGRFGRDGIYVETGKLTAREASVQVLILPALILLWGIAAVSIAALVR